MLQFSYRVRVAENTLPAGELLRVRATDADGGAFGRVEYRLAADSDLLAIDPDTGAVRLERTLDRETEREIRVLIFAVDRGRPPRFGFANLTILVDDANDSPPVCARSKHIARLVEDAPNNALVTCIGATDADVGRNAALVYSLAAATRLSRRRSGRGGDDDDGDDDDEQLPFRVDRESGCVFTRLDRPLASAARSSYDFNVTVSGGGGGDPKRHFERLAFCRSSILVRRRSQLRAPCASKSFA